jgi:hypothetical protein
MNTQTQKIITIALIVIGIIGITLNILNMQVTIGQAEAFLAGQVKQPIPTSVTWLLAVIEIIPFFYVMSVGQFKKRNYFWILLLPLGCIVIGTRQLLKLTKPTVKSD